MSENVNEIFGIIKHAIDIKSKSIKLIGFFNSKALVNIQNIINSEEIKLADYKLFFENFMKFLQEEFLDKKPVKQSHPEKTFKDFILNSNDTTFKLKGLSEETILKKKENAVFFKILTLLTDSSFETLTIWKVSQIYITLELFLNKKIDFPLVESTYLNAIYYSLVHAEPFEAANMLAKLTQVSLLNESNLKSLKDNFKLNIILLTNVIDKLSLNKGTDSLLTQTNLDKLLNNSQLTLESIAKFIQAGDKSKALTQEKFDLAIILNKLLTDDNIKKIEKTDIDHADLTEIFQALALSNILTQENFDSLITFDKSDGKKIASTFKGFGGQELFNQDNLDAILNTYLKTSIYDEKGDAIDSATGRKSPKTSLTDRLLAMLKDFFCGISKKSQYLLDKIINEFNKMAERGNEEPEARNTNSFFKKAPSSKPEDVNNNTESPTFNPSV